MLVPLPIIQNVVIIKYDCNNRKKKKTLHTERGLCLILEVHCTTVLQYQPDGKHQQRLLSPSSTKLSGDAQWHEGCSTVVCRAMHCQCRCLRTSSIIDRFTGTASSDEQLCVSDSKLTELSGGCKCWWPRGAQGPNELSWYHVQLMHVKQYGNN